MRKYMKYEIKGTYKFILGILLVVLIASTVIQLNVQSDISGGTNGFEGLGFKALLFITSILVIFGAFLTAFFYIIGSFRKELYDDRGYLTFTLPLTGNQILGSKLLVSLLWYITLGSGIVIYNMLLSLILFGNEWTYIIKTIFENINMSIISVGIMGIVSTIVTLILIYFSIALSRVSIRNKKIGGIWFVVFIILNMFVTFITYKVSGLFPYYLNLSNFSIDHIYNINTFLTQSVNSVDSFNAINGMQILGNGSDALMFMGSDFKPYINIFGNLFQIGVMVVGFLGTGYLIEKKIDL
jgi:hypothetical protein